MSTTTLVGKQSGKRLNKIWGVQAKHALYHCDGHWFNNLERFPGALFDPHGYVLFQTEHAYRSSAHLRVTQQTNVPNGISAMPGYNKVT
ncbi:hypothetical protein [Lysobacter sp. F6437]|uniref:hypothetical protein n=1 Tax=Lysobacter sp. F6437 TaxID=3459296 RepID=UPI00403D5BDF